MAICINCMTSEQGPDGVCPVCKKSDSDIRTMRRYLPWRTLLNKRYVIGKSIGKGGFANTYIAYDEFLKTRVAIKEFFPRDDVERDDDGLTVVPVSDESEAYFNETVGKFADEAGRLARFRSEIGIVTVFDIFHENNTSYIVMEYIDGMSLRSHIQKLNKPMTFNRVMELMSPMLRTLSRMHESGMVHRDISPDNIMLTWNLSRIYLIDFGSAREANPVEGGKTMSISYKDSYSPPEQHNQDIKQGPWSDIYAICATIYHCITLERPQDSYARSVQDSLKLPSELGAVITPQQEAVLMKGLAIRPQDRIRSIQEFFELLGYGFRGKNNKPRVAEANVKSQINEIKKEEALKEVEKEVLPNFDKDDYKDDASVTMSPRNFVYIAGKKVPRVDKTEYEEDLPVTVGVLPK